MRVGLFGGTFDPIHHGHLDVADAAKRALNLARVYLIPASIPPHRTPPLASAAHRFAMTALARQGREDLPVSDVEMRSTSASYTTDTLDRMVSSGLDIRDCCFVIGADAFRDIRSWKAYSSLLTRCSFAVISRPHTRVDVLKGLLPELSDRMVDLDPAGAGVRSTTPSIFLVDAPTAPVSSTDIRRRVAEHAPIADLVPAAVAEYIHTHGLYTEKAPTPIA